MTQKAQIGDLMVGEQFTYAKSVYEVKRIARDAPWPSPRWFYVGPPGNKGEECRLPQDQEVEPLQSGPSVEAEKRRARNSFGPGFPLPVS